MQFRQSIKRLFGIHSKGGISQTEKGYGNTVLSPTHKFLRTNDNSRFNLCETNVSTVLKKQVVIRDGKVKVNEERCNFTDNEDNPAMNPLFTIKEKKTASDAEESGETIYEEDSSSKQKLEVFDESSHIYTEGSPVLTILDSERLVFSKQRRLQKNKHDSDDSVNQNVYGNRAFEDHSSDATSDYGTSSEHVRDTEAVASTKIRRIGGFNKGRISTKFFESHESSQGREFFKTYLYRTDNSSENDDDRYVV